ncbi:hypothetical protein M4951_23105 [Blastopirellula sp. J2-11]|uniref:hypothetical protein n=1 Tax=Blastopirellula sp. J2-11 TaxID=2943192 RepID=UPI0021C6DB90|nr:hypothetical protein [Blastopirellula sp. J2-11]UUO06231.1 hypothetical protein M4951_23105 [Blastopirellula sp. J2-11]
MEYLRLLPYHSLTRWIVLLSAFWALAQAWHGLLCRRKWTRSDTRAGLTFTTVANLQFLLGLFLYVSSPHIKPLFGDPAYAFSSYMAFFLTAYHPSMMFLAIGFAQAVYSVAKRVEDDRKKFRWAAYGYSLAIVLMIAAIPWPSYSFGRPFFRPFVSDVDQRTSVPLHH